jgi:fatty acid desaturase
LRLYAKTVIALAATVISWTCLLLAPHEPIVVAACFAGLALGLTLIALCVQHDANHGAFFRKQRNNHLLGWTADALLGFSSYAWRFKHNVSHHTYTNVDGCDDDVSQVPLARFAPSQEPRRWYRFQHFYIWPMYTLMGLRLQTVGDITAFARGGVGESALRTPRGWNLAGVIVGKAIFVTWAIAVPLLVYPWWAVLGAYLGFLGTHPKFQKYVDAQEAKATRQDGGQAATATARRMNDRLGNLPDAVLYFVFRSSASTAARIGIPACPPCWAALSAAAAEAKRMRSFSSIPRARTAA